jgi:hypothetical protein
LTGFNNKIANNRFLIFFFTFNYPCGFYLNIEINEFFMSAKCSRCGQEKGLKITYYNKMDGTVLHLICTDCLDDFIKKQSPALE